MIRQVSMKIVPLTMELAQDVYSAPAFPGERPYKKARERFLRAKLEDGVFYGPRWSFCTVDGVRYRANGQHSSGMLVNLDGNFPTGLEVCIDEFEADSLRELADLFGQFDHKKGTRSRGEIVNAHARIHPELEKFGLTPLTICASGIAYGISDGGMVRTQTDEERAQVLHENIPFVMWMKEFLGTPRLGRATVVGAIYRTYGRDRGDALEFWRWVRDESHPDCKHASRVLSRFLRESRMGKGPGTWPPRAFYVKCIHAWNASRREEPTILRYSSTAAIPKVL